MTRRVLHPHINGYPIFFWDRYKGGRKMASGVKISKRPNFGLALVEALNLCDRGDDLILRKVKVRAGVR